jgi:mannosylglycerate hydrolase
MEVVMKKVHLIPHVHWDREWYFTTEESQILLVNHLDEVLDFLETHPEYPYYVLDGQTVILEDYLSVKPENEERIRQLVRDGRLIIGPWYTQTDEMVVGGESIVRNLLYGLKDCEAFGEPMKIGYLPDSFGQSAQLPQILNGFHIRHCIFWRGLSERHGTEKSEFYWQSADGSKVLVLWLPLGYAIGKYLPEEEEKLRARIDSYFRVLDPRATSDHIILPNGHDQMPLQKNIFDVMEKLRKLYPDREFVLSRYENVFAEIEKNGDLPIVQGEFLDGKYMRVHRSIYSTRMDIKAANTRLEHKMTHILEPLVTLAFRLGFAYHHGLIESIWKEMMKNQAHDSIGCCCSDKVHQEILSRFLMAEEKADQLIRFYQRKIVDAMRCEQNGDRLTVFNLLPYEREEVVTATVTTKWKTFQLVDENNEALDFDVIHREIVDPGLIDRQIVHYGNYEPFIRYTVQFRDRLPAMGYKTYIVVEEGQELADSTVSVQEIETEYYTIAVNENGTLRIFDKQLQRTFDQVLLLEDTGDDGDEYDFSPLPGDRPLYSDCVQAKVEMKQNRFQAVIDIRLAMNVPGDLQKRREGVYDRTVDVHWVVTIPNHKRRIEVKGELENHALDHRLRVLIPTGIASSFSLADNPFGVIRRPVYDPAMEKWKEEEWEERPDAIYPMLSFVGLSNEAYGVGVLTNSTREYEVVGPAYDTIALTLFRSVGVLGKEELLRRPGRPSGIKLPAPDSQMLRPLTLEFAIVTHDRSTLQAQVARMAKEYLTPVLTYNKIPYDAMKMNREEIQTPVRFSFLREGQPAVVLSTLKKAEKENAFVLRVYNPGDEEKSASFIFPQDVTRAYLADLKEQPVEPLPLSGHNVSFTLLPNQVKTILFA